jgi:hypothetical protein
MNGLVLAVSSLVVPGCCRGPTLDKTGTTGSPTGVAGSKALRKQEPAGAGSSRAERAGFSYRDPVAHPEWWQRTGILGG